MPEAKARPGTGARRRGIISLAMLVAVIAALNGLTLLYDHSLHSIDGAMQTWFALDNFAGGNQLGTDFQSYLGVTMMLGLLPGFLAFGGTLFASTLSAKVAVIMGAFATAYAIAWMIRWIRPDQRWWVAALLVFIVYYLGSAAVQTVGLRYPVSFDPGVSLRPIRGLLPFLVLPLFVVWMRKVLSTGSALSMLALGLISGIGLLWSNDAGIPLIIALSGAVVLAIRERIALLVKSLSLLVVGVVGGAGGLLLLVTHAAPVPWLQYNFRDVAGDQFWYFAPWDPSTRVLGLTDLTKLLFTGELLSTISLITLTVCVIIAAIRRLIGRGAPVRDSAFVLVGASTLGTALIPQIGGHVDGVYNNITFFLGMCAPFIVFQRRVFWFAKPLIRRLPHAGPGATTALAATIMVGTEAANFGMTVGQTERVAYDQDLGFYVSEEFAADLEAMRALSTSWDAKNIDADRRLLSVYTSALDVAAGTQSPAPVGSLIHALGPKTRSQYTALVANSQVEAVTTILPSYSGWEGWILRANWPFFQALRANYRPLAATDQHVVWVRSEPISQSTSEAQCLVEPIAQNALKLTIVAPASGWVSVSLQRQEPFGAGRSAVLTVTEASPQTREVQNDLWSDFPRYGVANVSELSLVAPVGVGAETELLLEVIDGSAIGSAKCSAFVFDDVDYASLPGLPEGIQRHLNGGAK